MTEQYSTDPDAPTCHGDGEYHCCCNEPCDIPPEGSQS